jgi:hypothetical protein
MALHSWVDADIIGSHEELMHKGAKIIETGDKKLQKERKEKAAAAKAAEMTTIELESD